MSWILCLLSTLILDGNLLVSSVQTQEKLLLKEAYEDKVYASWLGQCVGNIYGLPHENKYIDQPGQETFPYGYGPMLENLRQCNGAFSDDDTDLEYMDLAAMEKYGPEPSYEQMAGMWTHHIKTYIWIANRAALALMNFGYTPPVTGYSTLNPHWFQIDPQLVNEIWAVTAPGMVPYATGKSAWGASITNSGWGIEPTMHYGAMYAAAFFESDVRKLIDLGVAALPEGCRYAETVRKVESIYDQYPNDWRKGREEMARVFYHEEPVPTRTIWNANLNGACGILALLYGQGDFQKTLDYACAIGFDADNQAATLCGLLGVAKGTAAIPHDLLYPIPELGWKEPFNDFYKNRTREDLPDASLKDLARRTVLMGEKVMFSHGGALVQTPQGKTYRINSSAEYIAPLEIPSQPLPVLEVGKPVSFEIAHSGGIQPQKWALYTGIIPDGLRIADGRLEGTPKKACVRPVEIALSDGSMTARRTLRLLVRTPNLAPSAEKVLARVEKNDLKKAAENTSRSLASYMAESVEAIRDGKLVGEGSCFNSYWNGPSGKDYFGYEWKEPQKIGLLGYHTGMMDGDAGWFRDLGVEYLNDQGQWKAVDELIIEPPLVEGPEPENKPHWVEYLLHFKGVSTRGIRIIGEPMGHGEGEGRRSWISITELSVHGPIELGR